MKDIQWLQEVVPPQKTGKSTVTKSHITCQSNYLAHEYYGAASQRLLDVNKWHEYAGKGTAVFQLTDNQGHAVNRTAQKGDYFRIDIPGPGNPAGDGEDWVEVQETGEKKKGKRQLCYLTVRAADNPLKPPTETAHFFDQTATSTFMIYRENFTIVAAVYGRNEHANLQSRNFFTRIRNWLIYIGAQLGFSKLQWKSLTRGLLNVNQS
jgi:hypothetical protein